MADTKNSSNMNGGILLAAATNHWLRVIIARLLWCFVSFFWVSFSGLFYRTWSPHGPTGREPEHTWLSARTHRLTSFDLESRTAFEFKKKTIYWYEHGFSDLYAAADENWNLILEGCHRRFSQISEKFLQTWYFTCLTRNTPARHVLIRDRIPNCLGENDKPVIHIVFVFLVYQSMSALFFVFAIFDISCHVFSWLWSRVFWFEYVCAFKSWSAFHFCIQSKLHFWKRSTSTKSKNFWGGKVFECFISFLSLTFWSNQIFCTWCHQSVGSQTQRFFFRRNGGSTDQGKVRFLRIQVVITKNPFVCRFTTCLKPRMFSLPLSPFDSWKPQVQKWLEFRTIISLFLSWLAFLACFDWGTPHELPVCDTSQPPLTPWWSLPRVFDST